MDSLPQRRNRRQSSKEPLDRRVDKWLQTGRQFVDGVAGTRPGQRRPDGSMRRTPSNLKTVGRWVEDKIDWLLDEEEESWACDEEDFQSFHENISAKSKKRPLDAISLRVAKFQREEVAKNNLADFDNEWPEEESFQVQRWQRPLINNQESEEKVNLTNLRPLPKSTRRRS